ncbi:hypothetical protein CLOSTMETH_00984 [[Clostridium] methylpentosum DSM 5476]|uniref:Uncharacterized protein n=1 Tax=[Clostridium] methylpentosum DSM 5476 TaxID=537013 RepID=C0EAW6_9FIRM|nr:hypothetical protein CLOSTMETH_00984 [[Clostridium] methylpentosum DSM 5476]
MSSTVFLFKEVILAILSIQPPRADGTNFIICYTCNNPKSIIPEHPAFFKGFSPFSCKINGIFHL